MANPNFPSEQTQQTPYVTEISRAGSTLSQEELKEVQIEDIRRTQTAIHEESRRYSINSDSKPWVAEDGKTVVWSNTRIRMAKVIRLQQFEALMGCIIVFNLFLIIYETDHEAQCHPAGPAWADDPRECPYRSDKVAWIKYTNLALLITYTAEAALRIYVERWQYFRNRWNVLDFSVVFVGWLSEALGGVISLAFLRIFRIARLSRAFRIVLSIRELYMLITGVVSSMKAIFFGMLLLFGMLTLWAIVLVDFVHPVNATIDYTGCDRCGRGYATVKDSVLTIFQQIVAGDSWGLLSIPIIEEEPAMAPLLFAVLISVSLGVMNLILAVIVESAAEAREQDLEQKTKHKLDERKHKKMELLKLCVDLDKDFSDTISYEEMEKAWDESTRFRNVMAVLEVSREDLESIFQILDVDNSGEVDYREFVDRLYALRTSDVRLKLEQIKIDLTSHISLYHQRHQEHEMKLERHFQLLQNIDSKLGNLSRESAFSKTGDGHPAADGLMVLPKPLVNGKTTTTNGEKTPLLTKSFSLIMPQGDDYTPDFMCGAEAGLTTNRDHPSNLVAGTVASREGSKCLSEGSSINPQLQFNPDLAVMSTVPDVAEVSSGLGQLQQHIEQLATLKVEIVRKAEEQARALHRHVGVLSSVQSALLHGSLPRQRLGAFNGTLRELQRHVQQRLSLVVRNLNTIVGEEGVDLATTSALIEALSGYAQPQRSGLG